MASLVIKRGDDTVDTLDLKPGDITIGKLPVNTLSLDTETISDRHVRFVTAGRTTYVQDLNSKLGTRVNNERIERQKLKHGDVVQIGDVQIHYESAPPENNEDAGQDADDDFGVDAGEIASSNEEVLVGDPTLDHDQFVTQLRQSEENLFGSEKPSDPKSDPEGATEDDLDATLRMDSTLGRLRDVFESLRESEAEKAEAPDTPASEKAEDDAVRKWTELVAELPELDIDFSVLEISSPVDEVVPEPEETEVEEASTADEAIEITEPEAAEVGPTKAVRYPRLRLLSGGHYGAHIRLHRDNLLIGFSGKRQLDVSRENGSFLVRAGKDEEHLVINGSPPADEGATLKDGDIVEITGMRFRFSEQ